MKKNLIVLMFIFLLVNMINAQSLPWLQTDWSGGTGQTNWSSVSKFFSASNIDCSVVGQISLQSKPSVAGCFGAMIEYDNKLFAGHSTGVYTYDATNQKWELSLPYYLLNRKFLIKDELLYAFGYSHIAVYDKSFNDYGLGKNGWRLLDRSSLLSTIGFHSATIFNGEIYVASVNHLSSSSGGLIYKYTNNTFVQVGQQIEKAAISLCEYNNVLYCGTHWSGQLYKLSGTKWVNAGFAKGMTLWDLQVWEGKLYIASQTSSVTTGTVSKFDGKTFTQIYSGAGISRLLALDDLYFGGFGSNKLFKYNGTTVSQHAVMSAKAYNLGAIASYNEDIYFSPGYSTSSTSPLNADDGIYKNAEKLTDLRTGVLVSSDYSVDTDTNWGKMTMTANQAENCGIGVMTQTKNKTEAWANNWIEAKNNEQCAIDKKQGQYSLCFWSAVKDVNPICYDIKFDEDSISSIRNLYSNISGLSISNYPNPFNFSTKIYFNLPESGFVTIGLYDLSGKLISVIMDGYTPAGNYSFNYYPEANLKRGVYLCKLRTSFGLKVLKLAVN